MKTKFKFTNNGPNKQSSSTHLSYWHLIVSVYSVNRCVIVTGGKGAAGNTDLCLKFVSFIPV